MGSSGDGVPALPAQGHLQQADQDLVFNISLGRDSTTSLASLCQRLTNLTIKTRVFLHEVPANTSSKRRCSCPIQSHGTRAVTSVSTQQQTPRELVGSSLSLHPAIEQPSLSLNRVASWPFGKPKARLFHVISDTLLKGAAQLHSAHTRGCISASLLCSHADLGPAHIYDAALQLCFIKTSACCLKLIFPPLVDQLKIGFAY